MPTKIVQKQLSRFRTIGVDSGWEIHVAGNGGIKVRVTDLLCKVETDEELLEYTKSIYAISQRRLYYLERTAHWVERTGLKYIKDVMLDTEKENFSFRI